MDQETILRRFASPVQNDGDGPFTHAILPGLFRAAIVKPRNNKNSQKNDCRRKRDCGMASKHGVKRLRRSKVHLRSSNFSVADLILIDNTSGETLSPDHIHSPCPAYRFCVERAAAAASVGGVSVGQEDSVICSELPTLRELLEPIKETALRMKQLSQVTDECCKAESDIVTEDSSTCQVCGMKIPTSSISSDSAAEQQFNMFGEGDNLSKLDGNVFVRIITGPGMEPGQLTGDPLMSVIQQIVAQMPNIQQEQSERKEKPITSIIDEYKEMQDIDIQSPGYSKENGDTLEEDSLSLQSYEFIKTMDIGCGDEPETRNNDVLSYGGNDYQNDHNGAIDPMLLSILTILQNNQRADLTKSNTKQTRVVDPTCSIEPKSRDLEDFVNKSTPGQDKSVDCTCGFKLDPAYTYPDVKSSNKVEVTNAVSFKSSYFLENLETMNMGPVDQSNSSVCCSKDVSTSTYKISIYKQITSMSQSKITTSRKRSSSSQCEIGSESIRQLSCCDEGQGKTKLEPRTTGSLKKRNSIPETIEELCPCGCGFFLEGDDTCSCGCAGSSTSPHQASKVFDRSKYTIDSMKDSNISHGGNIKSQENKYPENCPCGCDDVSQTKDVPLDPVVKLMNHRYECNDETKNDSTVNKSKMLEIDKNKPNEGMDLEEEARKLQHKIRCYRKENEYFRKLIQQACNGCQENVDALSRTPPIRATYSGLATAIEILQAKCRSKDGMIAILAEGLRGVVNYAQIAKNLAAPCLEYTYWDFDQSALYTYLRGTMSRLSVECEGSKNADEPTKKCECPSDSKEKQFVPPPTDFKIEHLCKCLFVSWKIPENISNVAGYRIYVNGNLATNVRSPTRTETILGFEDTSKSTELVLHSFNKDDILSDPVTIIYHPNNNKNNNSNQ